MDMIAVSLQQPHSSKKTSSLSSSNEVVVVVLEVDSWYLGTLGGTPNRDP